MSKRKSSKGWLFPSTRRKKNRGRGIAEWRAKRMKEVMEAGIESRTTRSAGAEPTENDAELRPLTPEPREEREESRATLAEPLEGSGESRATRTELLEESVESRSTATKPKVLSQEPSAGQSRTKWWNTFPVSSISGRRIVDIRHFVFELQKLNEHNDVGCSLSDICFKSEYKKGLLSSFRVVCRFCKFEKIISTEDPEKENINTDVVSGLLSVGCGYWNMKEMFKKMKIPIMPRPLFEKEYKAAARERGAGTSGAMEEDDAMIYDCDVSIDEKMEVAPVEVLPSHQSPEQAAVYQSPEVAAVHCGESTEEIVNEQTPLIVGKINSTQSSCCESNRAILSSSETIHNNQSSQHYSEQKHRTASKRTCTRQSSIHSRIENKVPLAKIVNIQQVLAHRDRPEALSNVLELPPYLQTIRCGGEIHYDPTRALQNMLEPLSQEAPVNQASSNIPAGVRPKGWAAKVWTEANVNTPPRAPIRETNLNPPARDPIREANLNPPLRAPIREANLNSLPRAPQKESEHSLKFGAASSCGEQRSFICMKCLKEFPTRENLQKHKEKECSVNFGMSSISTGGTSFQRTYKRDCTVSSAEIHPDNVQQAVFPVKIEPEDT